jgi:hypothetical protein
MNKKTVVCLAVLILSPLIIYFLWPSDESRIKKLFREGAEAIEQEKTEDVMAKVSFNYRGEDGLTYLLIKEGMGRFSREMSAIKIEYEIKNITVKDASAIADLDIRVIASYGKDTGYAAGDAAKPAHMRFFLEKERTRWLVHRTEGIALNF